MEEAMTPEQVRDRMTLIAQQDGRYAPAAFFFVYEVVANTVKWLKAGEMQPHDVAGVRGVDGENFHISGYELLEGMRRLARERWGLLARSVLERWRVYRTEDIGEIVYIMVDDSELQWKRRDSDTKADFANGYDFSEAFDSWG